MLLRDRLRMRGLHPIRIAGGLEISLEEACELARKVDDLGLGRYYERTKLLFLEGEPNLHGRSRPPGARRWTSVTLRELRRLVSPTSEDRVISAKALARAVGVTDMAVSHWLRGCCVATPERQALAREALNAALKAAGRA